MTAPTRAPDGRLTARTGSGPHVQARPPLRPWAPSAAALTCGLGLGASAAMPVAEATSSSLRAAGGPATLLGDVTAMAGTFLLLVMVLLAGRIPAVEAVLGQDRLIRWHRLLSPVPLLLLGAHAVLTTLGFAQAARSGILGEAGSILTTMGWMVAALVSYLMLVAIAAVSIRVARRRINYDTWWVIHLYTYLALAFSVPHQIFSGTDFVGHPALKAAWLVLWLATAGTVLAYRVVVPIWRSAYHRLEVYEVRREGPGTYALVVRGRHLDRLPVAGGQYFQWRFLTRDLWWHAHPFSLSAMPAPPYLRVTIKVAGDTTARIQALSPGTRIAIEGPYGAFTAASRLRSKVAMIGAGVGITPLRALLEDLQPGVDVVVVQRASTEQDLIHRAEMEQLVANRGGRMVALVGPRARHRLADPRTLRKVVPDLATRDLYVCGPEEFAADVAAAAATIGVPAAAIHRESFEF